MIADIIIFILGGVCGYYIRVILEKIYLKFLKNHPDVFKTRKELIDVLLEK